MTILEAQKNWRILDEVEFVTPEGVRLISHEFYDDKYTDGLLPVEEIKQGLLSKMFSFSKIFSSFLWALKLLIVANNKTVILANGSTIIGDFTCILNYLFFFNSKKILYWDSHLEPKNIIKNVFAKLCFKGCYLATMWSQKQVTTYSNKYKLPEKTFIFIPYKANHSKYEQRVLPTLDYIFAGGNGKRDYESLVEAVRDTNISVIISATKPEVLDVIEDIPNVIKLSATEPSFSKLMASARFVVIPLISTGLKGGGEANFCNAMWHKKAVIAVDDMSAIDYILDGETGYIVPPADIAQLRNKILDLWNNREKAETMGKKGHNFVQQYYTQVQGIRRLVKLACLVGQEVYINNKSQRK